MAASPGDLEGLDLDDHDHDMVGDEPDGAAAAPVLGCPVLAHAKLTVMNDGRTTLTHLVSNEGVILPEGADYSIECRPTENLYVCMPWVVSYDRTFARPLYAFFMEVLEEDEDECFLRLKHKVNELVLKPRPKQSTNEK